MSSDIPFVWLKKISQRRKGTQRIVFFLANFAPLREEKILKFRDYKVLFLYKFSCLYIFSASDTVEVNARRNIFQT